MGRKKRRRTSRRDLNVGESKFTPTWKKLYREAVERGMNEEERAVIAKKVAMMHAMKTFTRELGKTLGECDTNLGLLLESADAVSASMTLHGTEDAGTDEYVPVKMIIQIGPVQELEEHIEFMKNGWMMKKPGEENQVQVTQPSL